MGCSHAVECPLFPFLKASLKGWRDYYCDSESRWRECARYRLSLTGERVPISLLPNGHHAQHIGHASSDGPSRAANPRQARRQTPPQPAPPEKASWLQPAPAPTPESSGPGYTAPGATTPFEHAPWSASETAAQFESAPPPAPTWHRQPSPHAQVPQPPNGRAQRTRQKPSSKRGWWARLVDWMRGPA